MPTTCSRRFHGQKYDKWFVTGLFPHSAWQLSCVASRCAESFRTKIQSILLTSYYPNLLSCRARYVSLQNVFIWLAVALDLDGKGTQGFYMYISTYLFEKTNKSTLPPFFLFISFSGMRRKWSVEVHVKSGSFSNSYTEQLTETQCTKQKSS